MQPRIPIGVQIARGAVAGVSASRVHGHMDGATTTDSTIWDGAGTGGTGGTYSYLAAASVLKLSSSSANDTAAGTGARTVHVQGLDANYAEIEEHVTLNGQTAVNTANTYLRVFHAHVKTAGSGGTNAGDIYVGTGVVTAGVPATKYAKILVGKAQTSAALYTVPAGKTAYITSQGFSSGKGDDVEFKVMARELGGVFADIDEQHTYQGNAEIDYGPCSHELAEKTDIEIRAKVAVSTASVTGHICLVIVQEGEI